jgi:hypothetical protein
MSVFEKSGSFDELDELLEGTGPGITVSLLAELALLLSLSFNPGMNKNVISLGKNRISLGKKFQTYQLWGIQVNSRTK